MSDWHPTWIEINVQQFRKNLQTVRAFIGKRLFCLPIKANAYGHGLVAMGKIAAEEGVDYLAVAHANEGALLRRAGVKIPILVLGAIHKEQVEDLLINGLEISVSSRLKAELIRTQCKLLGNRCKVHIEVDTGMHRTGMRPETALGLYRELAHDPCFEIVGIYSHLAGTDAYGKEQMQVFQEVCKKIDKPVIRHIENSTGMLAFPESQMDMVRPALLTFGYMDLEGIAPCFSLKSTVSYFKVVEKGKGISYNHTFHTQSSSRIVTIPVGYGDGYRRDLSNKGYVLIRGKKYPIVGTVCMDQFMVDIGNDDVFVGDEVVLIGKQGSEEIPLQEIANICNTIPYEILCGLNERVPRIYV